MAIAVVRPFDQFFDDNGDPLNGGTVTVQDAGTSTPRAIYTDVALTVPATNPIPLDSAGRPEQGMIYTAPTAYKIIVKNSSGFAVGDTADYVDPGVPLGTGRLAIANGGTGADDAAEALTNLGGVSAAAVAELEAEVASLAGAASSTEKTHIATGTTGQRTASPEFGDIRANSTTTEYEAYISGGWDNLMFEAGNLASTANVSGEASTALYVRPDRMKYHPGVAKAWARVEAADSSPSYVDSSGFDTGTAITDHGNGQYTLTFSTAMANTNYSAQVTVLSTAACRVGHIHTLATGTVRVLITSADGTATDADFMIVVHGDL